MSKADYRIEVLVQEEWGKAALIWIPIWKNNNNAKRGVAWRVMGGNRELAIYDNLTSANDALGVLKSNSGSVKS